MPALAAAGYHVIVPNQRGYGNSSRPEDVTEYDIVNLTGDLATLLDHFGYNDAVFVGHDWGANVVLEHGAPASNSRQEDRQPRTSLSGADAGAVD